MHTFLLFQFFPPVLFQEFSTQKHIYFTLVFCFVFGVGEPDWTENK